jgi:uncharacterized protein involved in exopolysaccharide biosynthesis
MFRYNSDKPRRAAKPVTPDAEMRRSEPVRSDLGVLSLLSAIWRRKVWPASLAVLGAGMTALATMSLPDQYHSSAQLLIDPRELRILGTDVTPGNLNADSIVAYLESQTRIITSSDMLRRIVDREKLTSDEEFVGKPSLLSRLLPTRKASDKTSLAAERLFRQLNVRRGERTFVIDVTVAATTPDKAARLANAFAAAYLEDQTIARQEQVRRASNALTSRLNDLRERVRLAETKVETYKSQKGIITANGKLITEEQLLNAGTQLQSARARTADAKAKLDQIDNLRGQLPERGGVPEAVASSTLGLLRQQLGESQRRAAALANSLGPIHPDNVAAQTQLREARQAVQDEISRIRSAAKAEYDRALNNERTVQAQVDVLKKDTQVSGRDNVELRELERDLESNRTIYQTFLQRARETSEQERLDTTNARVITTAVPSLNRSGPQRRLMTMLGFIAGFGLGVLIAISDAIWRHLRSRPPRDLRTRQRQMSENMSGTNDVAAAQGTYRQTPDAAQPASRTVEQDDMLRMVRMISRLEKALDSRGTSR